MTNTKQHQEYSKDWTFDDIKTMFKAQTPFIYKGELVNIVEYGTRLGHTGKKLPYVNLSQRHECKQG